MKLYRFYWDCGRMGSVEGLFAAEPEDVKVAVGKRVYFGEILGKHSEVYGTLEEKDLQELPISDDIVAILVDHTGTEISGYNPLSYIDDSEDDVEENDYE